MTRGAPRVEGARTCAVSAVRTWTRARGGCARAGARARVDEGVGWERRAGGTRAGRADAAASASADANVVDDDVVGKTVRMKGREGGVGSVRVGAKGGRRCAIRRRWRRIGTFVAW